MRWRDLGIAFGVGTALGLLISFGGFGSQFFEDVAIPAFGSWYVGALAVVVSILPLWRELPGSIGRVIARVVGMLGVAFLAVLLAIAVVYVVLWPLIRGGP